MHKYRFFIFAALLACLVGVHVASAQTPANITVVTGNGQIFCSCTNAEFSDPNTNGPYPFVVLVTDANNRPISGASVNWNIVAGFGNFGSFFGFLPNATTTTAKDGTSSITFYPGGGTPGSSALPVLSQITATAGTASATFSLTQAFDAAGFGTDVGINTNNLPQTSITGTSPGPITANSGQQGFTFNGTSGNALSVSVITSGINSGQPLPGVSVRILNNSNQSANASCITGPGADPGSVLTDSNGNAVCTPVFTGSGNGVFQLVVGGTPLCNCAQDPPSPILNDGNLQDTYLNTHIFIQMTVANATVTSVTVVSGSGQSAVANSTVANPLVAAVNASTGGTLSGQSIVWSVSPNNAGTLLNNLNNSSTSDANGQVSNILTLSSSASGTVTVTAAFASNQSIKATFTINAIPLVTLGGITKVSGDGQAAIINTQFTNALVVQVNSSAGVPVANIPVSFSATGGALLSATQVSTGSNGQAQVSVTAGGTPGSVTVTASASGFNVTFNLTISPPGPNITASSFANAADQRVGSISPCSLATIFASGIAAGVQGVVTGNLFGLGGLSNTLATDTVTVGNTQAPILNVASINGQQQLTFQVPCNASTGSTQVTVGVGAGSGSATVTLLPASPGVFQTSTTITLANGGTYPMGIFARPDGSFVSPSNPARSGETVVAYVTGLGAASPPVVTNAVPLLTAISTPVNSLVIGIANAGVPLVSAQLSPDLVGVYQVAFQVPAGTTSGNQVFSVGVSVGGQTYYSAGSAIPIQQ